ncbi:cbb3-type cytochrome c oxidase subunit 3 [Hyphomonas oceanitis]|uniref:cbb3-type cytochrome c oxidase subunit 3 n=1 Tax=Hyphomonas oceanitis TaxID=81033 RepID=UPI003002F653
MYETLSHFAQTWGLALFVAMFAVALVYALWPTNKTKFREAAYLPLEDKEPGDE